MARRKPSAAASIRLTPIAVGVLLQAAAALALAQGCDGPLPAPGNTGGSGSGEKFRMIAEQCDVLDAPVSTRRSGQLDVYDRGASVSISMAPVPGPAVDGASTGTGADRREARPTDRWVAAPGTAPGAAPSPAGNERPLARDAAPLSRDATRVLTLAPAITATANQFEIDPLLLHAIAHVESRHNADAVSPAGARGVMQMMPATARRFGVTDAERRLHEPDTNLRASAALLRTLFTRYGDDLKLVLAAYNAGEGAVDKYGRQVPPYPETQAYVRDVMAIHRELAARFTVTERGTLVARRSR